MLQSEIDEISDAFLDAWKEYFGQVMYYIPMNKDATTVHPIYGESKNKAYKEGEKVPFNGTFKQEPIQERGELSGRELSEIAEITFVTKELYDKGVLDVKQEDIIEMTNRQGVTKRYNIIENFGKVQLGDNRIFTKLKVAWYEHG